MAAMLTPTTITGIESKASLTFISLLILLMASPFTSAGYLFDKTIGGFPLKCCAGEHASCGKSTFIFFLEFLRIS
ncbi:hypothetical protein L21SP2_1083 [Salinispira pacifica]|uniref:Uncharacterized protein n=1 Tax=Salinispira pacifica TaxID=1307761 RepID=V5WFT2_9SPIO|nr:hypothetical protein L21SP2_1083 [Salinispira pacifica]